MDNSNVQTSPNEEEKQPHLHSKGGLKRRRSSRSVTSNVIHKGEAVPKSFGSWSMDNPWRNATGVVDRARPLPSSEFSGHSDTNELYNYGRAPLNWDFGADSTRPLPFSNEDAYGGGSRLRIGGEEQALCSGNLGNGPPVELPVPPTGVKSKQKPTQLADLSVKLAQQVYLEASIPQFGGWNSNPSEAENYKVAFPTGEVERLTSLNDEVPPTAHQEPRSKSQEQPVQLVVPSNGMKPEQKPTHRVSRSVEITKMNKGCFSWF